MDEAATSMAGPAAGSSDCWSIAFTAVTATSSAWVTAFERQPPAGSIASTHGGATSTFSTDVPAGSWSAAVYAPGSRWAGPASTHPVRAAGTSVNVAAGPECPN